MTVYPMPVLDELAVMCSAIGWSSENVVVVKGTSITSSEVSQATMPTGTFVASQLYPRARAW